MAQPAPKANTCANDKAANVEPAGQEVVPPVVAPMLPVYAPIPCFNQIPDWQDRQKIERVPNASLMLELPSAMKYVAMVYVPGGSRLRHVELAWGLPPNESILLLMLQITPFNFTST